MKKEKRNGTKRMSKMFCLCLSVGIVLLSACSDDTGEVIENLPSITFEKGKRLVFPVGETDARTTITSNMEWKVSTQPAWLEVRVPESTVGTVDMELEILEFSEQERKGFVILTDKQGLNFKTKMLVTSPAFEVHWKVPKEITFMGITSELEISANFEVKLLAFVVKKDTVLDVKADWIAFTKVGPNNWKMTVEENDASIRIAKVFVVPVDCDETLANAKLYGGKEVKQLEVPDLYFFTKEDPNTRMTELNVFNLSGMQSVVFGSNFINKLDKTSCRLVILENEGTDKEKERVLASAPSGYIVYQGLTFIQAAVPVINKPGVMIMGKPNKDTTPIWFAVNLVFEGGTKITGYLKLLREPSE